MNSPALVALTLCLLGTAAAVSTSLAEDGALHPADLRCESEINPVGLGETQPQLSWIGESPRRGETQHAYQVQVASAAELLEQGQGDLWDSGKVASDESAHVLYAGRPLVSRADCFWRVRVWDADDRPSAWSPVAHWQIGLLKPEDWQARWIQAPQTPGTATILHATFETGDGQTKRDVTDLVNNALKAAPDASIVVNNDTLGGELAPKKRQRLRVEYTYAGLPPATKLFGEKQRFSLVDLGQALPSLRRSFTVGGPVRRATLYVTALGLYECTLNGQRVGDHVIATEWTDYNKRVRYQAYDVTTLLKPGDNALGALLANGWYAGHLGNGGFQQYGKTPALLAQLEITGDDGQVQRIVSDSSWKSSPSPVLASDFMLGEIHDARRETAGWDAPGFDDHAWTDAVVREEPSRALDAQVAPPVRELLQLPARALTEPAPGRWTFDLGQNMVGVVRLKVTAPAGTPITLRYGEMLSPDGTIYTANLRGATSTDVYICKGGGEETWQPKFTFHGFRYVEVTGLTAKPEPGAIIGHVLGSDTPKTGTFSCSNPALNQLVSNIEWGQRGNYLSVPTDCPQRDERLGWMGDAQVFVRTATHNADVSTFFDKWLVDVDDAQREDGAFNIVSPSRGVGYGVPAWSDAGVICPWTIYQAYGDRRILERHLPAMTKWVEWCRAHSTGLIRDKDRGPDFGDWLAIGANTPKDMIGTAYFAYSTHLLARAYQAVGNTEGAAKYGNLFKEIRAAFNQRYVKEDGRIEGNTQCGYAMALKFGLLDAPQREKAVQYLADDIAAHGDHLTTGFVGVSYLLPVLTEGGRLDVAYRLLLQDTFPSWLFSVKQGATTIWERWDGWTPDKGFQSPSMNSFNHYSLGSCGEWIAGTVAGIDWDEATPGYHRMIIRPRPGGGLTWAKGTLRTAYGEVGSKWAIEGGRFKLDVWIPPNTSARVFLPTAAAGEMTEGGKPVAVGAPGVLKQGVEDGNVYVQVGSGDYHFECAAPQ